MSPSFVVTEPPLFDGLKRLECAKYARLAAKQLFDLDYNPAPTWNIGCVNQFLWRRGASSCYNWVDVARPGHLIGIYNPTSRFNTFWCGRRDLAGASRLFTHVTLYLGDRRIAHQFISTIQLCSLEDFLLKEGCSVAAVVGPRE